MKVEFVNILNEKNFILSDQEIRAFDQKIEHKWISFLRLHEQLGGGKNPIVDMVEKWATEIGSGNYFTWI